MANIVDIEQGLQPGDTIVLKNEIGEIHNVTGMTPKEMEKLSKHYKEPLHIETKGQVANKFFYDGVNTAYEFSALIPNNIILESFKEYKIVIEEVKEEEPKTKKANSDKEFKKFDSDKEFKKFDSDKIDYSLLEPIVVEMYCSVGQMGAKKYGRNNWKQSKKEDMCRYEAALLRHLMAYKSGEKKDPESGLSHLSHALWNLVALETKERE